MYAPGNNTGSTGRAGRARHGLCPRAGARLAPGGFSVIELLVTMAVAGILMAVAVPALRTLMTGDRQSSTAASLISSMSLARSTAIMSDLPASGGGVQACASVDGAHCCGTAGSPACDPNHPWNAGWIVTSSAQPNPLLVVQALPAGLSITTVPLASSVTFLSTGGMQINGTAARLELTVCDSRGAGAGRELEVSAGGQVQAASVVGTDVSGAALAAGNCT
jgi:type IV fimbrial biogenesis protein FimT